MHRLLSLWRRTRRPAPRRRRRGVTLLESVITVALVALGSLSIIEVARHWAIQTGIENETHALAEAVELAAHHVRKDMTNLLCATTQAAARSLPLTATDIVDETAGRTLTQVRGGEINFGLYRFPTTPADPATEGRLLVIGWMDAIPQHRSFRLPVPDSSVAIARRGRTGLVACPPTRFCGPTMTWTPPAAIVTALGIAEDSLVGLRMLSFEADRDPFLHRVRLADEATLCNQTGNANFRAGTHKLNRIEGDFDLKGQAVGGGGLEHLLVRDLDVNGNVAVQGRATQVGTLTPDQALFTADVTVDGWIQTRPAGAASGGILGRNALAPPLVIPDPLSPTPPAAPERAATTVVIQGTLAQATSTPPVTTRTTTMRTGGLDVAGDAEFGSLDVTGDARVTGTTNIRVHDDGGADGAAPGGSSVGTVSARDLVTRTITIAGDARLRSSAIASLNSGSGQTGAAVTVQGDYIVENTGGTFSHPTTEHFSHHLVVPGGCRVNGVPHAQYEATLGTGTAATGQGNPCKGEGW